jgi:hypothetical protein
MLPTSEIKSEVSTTIPIGAHDVIRNATSYSPETEYGRSIEVWNEAIKHARAGGKIWFNVAEGGRPASLYTEFPSVIKGLKFRGSKTLELDRMENGRIYMGTITNPSNVQRLKDNGFLVLPVATSEQFCKNNIKDIKRHEIVDNDIRRNKHLVNSGMAPGFVHLPCKALQILIDASDGKYDFQPEHVQEDKHAESVAAEAWELELEALSTSATVDNRIDCTDEAVSVEPTAEDQSTQDGAPDNEDDAEEDGSGF